MPLGKLVVCEPDYGSGERAIPIQTATDVKYIRITDFDNDGIVPGNEFATVENIENRYRLDDGDVLFARSGATAGKTFIYSSHIGPSIFAGYCIRFRFNRKEALPQFIYFYTKTDRYQAWVRSIQRPSGQPNINKEEFKSFTVPLPALPVQRSLVSEMEAARESRRRKLAEADALLSGLDAFLLARLGLTPPSPDGRLAFAVRMNQASNERFDPHFHHPNFRHLLAEIQRKPNKPLGDMVGFSKEQRDPANLAGETFRYIEISGVNRYTGEITANETPTREAPSRARMLVRQGDIIISLTRPHHGSIAFIDAEFDNCIASTGFSVVHEYKESASSPHYLLAILRSFLSLQQMLQRSSGGNYPAITEEELKRILLPIPDEKNEREIVDELRRRRMEARRLREEAAREWEAAKARFEARLLGEEPSR
jgi:restriction endonuclease S subunit